METKMTIRETILSVKPGETKKIPLAEISDPHSWRRRATEINTELSAQGVKTRDGRPPYSIARNNLLGHLYIINNIIEA